MSFGKRGLPNIPPNQTCRPAAARPRQGGFFDTKLGGQLKNLGMIVGIVAAASVAANIYFAHAFDDGDPQWVARPKEAARQDALLALRPPAIRELELSLDRQCTPNYAAKLRDASDPDRRKLILDERHWPTDLEAPMIQMTYREGAAYLACVMQTEQQRLCQPYFRKSLVSQLRSYADMRAKYLRQREERAGSFMALAMGDDNDEFAPTRDTSGVSTGTATHPLDSRIGDAVRNLSRQGYLAKSDFGWFGLNVPAEIANAFDNAEVNLCP
jgi:hypothetical protein